MNTDEFFEQLCKLHPDWQEVWDEGRNDRLYYVHVPTPGRALVDAVNEKRNEEWMQDAFSLIERAFEVGDDETQNLVVVGLFEAMQGHAYYRLEPPDALDAWFGPKSQTAWANLIEGWTGTGIRTMEHWKRVLTNGDVSRIEWSDAEREWIVDRTRTPESKEKPRASVRCRGGGIDGEGTLSEEDEERLFALFRPMTATKLEPFEASETALETWIVVSPSIRKTTLRWYGSHLGLHRGHDGKRGFLVDRTMIEDVWIAALRRAVSQLAQ